MRSKKPIKKTPRMTRAEKERAALEEERRLFGSGDLGSSLGSRTSDVADSTRLRRSEKERLIDHDRRDGLVPKSREF